MTDKAKKILQKLKRKEAARPLSLFRSPEARDRILNDFNRSSIIDDVGPIGGNQEMAVLKEMNNFQSDHDQFIKSLGSRV